jgi:hypothetical protein
MLQARSDLDLALEAVHAHAGGEAGREHLHGDRTAHVTHRRVRVSSICSAISSMSTAPRHQVLRAGRW